MEDGESSIIRVVGEEDLSASSTSMAPIGSVVLYGQPGRGLVIRWCDEESKIRCRNLSGFRNCFQHPNPMKAQTN